MNLDHSEIASEAVAPAPASGYGGKPAKEVEDRRETPVDDQRSKKGWRFWALFPALWLAAFLTALGATVLANPLPTISRDLSASSTYIWAINSYVPALTAVRPLVGQFTNIYGPFVMY